MPDEPPIEVLTELGRVTWAVIKLEDYVEDICSRVEDRPLLQEETRFISTQIANAKKILEDREPSTTRDRALEWLERARLAIRRRNATLHAMPLAFPGRDRRYDQFGLGQQRRGDRPYEEHRLTVEYLTELRSVLETAADGWRDLALALSGAS